jgi:hypothetical protein
MAAMKKVVVAACFIALLSCTNDKNDGTVGTDVITNSASAVGVEREDLPEIKFAEEEFDFGKISQGERVTHSFSFTNTGKSNLIISGASGSCGCTVPEWPQQPIKPGETGKIDVIFNSEGKSGLQEKTITVVTNCEPATRVLRIKTEVVVPETGNKNKQ